MEKRIFSVLFISVFIAMMGLGIVSPLMPIFAHSLKANGIWLGIVFASFSLSRAIFMPIIGKLSDKRGRKKIITLGLFLYCLISILYIFAKNVYFLTVVRILHGFSSAMVIPIAMAYIGDISKIGKEGKTIGSFNIAFFLGMGFGPFLGGIINDAFGIKAVFGAMSIFTGIAFLIALLFLPDKKYLKQKKASSNTSIKFLLKDKAIRGLLWYRAVSALGRGGTMAFLPIFATQIHMSPFQIGLIISLSIFLTGILQRYSGKLADLHRKETLVLIGALIGISALFCVPIAKNFWYLLVIFLIMGLGGAISMPAASAMVIQIGRKLGMGSSMGLFNTAMSIGMIFAPLIAGLVMDSLGVSFVFYIIGAISVVGLIPFYVYTREAV